MINIISDEERNFFERIAILVNNVPRYNFVNMSDKEFNNYLKRKFTKEKLNTIYSYMLIGEKPEEIASKIKDFCGFDIAKEYAEKLVKKGLNVSFERKIGKRYCDLIAYDKSKDRLIAFEIKSNGDKIDRALSQIEDYFKWAEQVYLIIDDRKKYEKITKDKRIIDFGIILYNQKTNTFIPIKKSKYQKRKLEDIKKLISKSNLKRLNENNWKQQLCK